MSIAAEIAAVCRSNINTQLITEQWGRLMNLAASVRNGYASAVAKLARFGSAVTGNPVYDASVQLGKLLRTSFLSDYFTNPLFRRELRRVFNRGETENAMKRSIDTGRIAPTQAKRPEDMQAAQPTLARGPISRSATIQRCSISRKNWALLTRMSLCIAGCRLSSRTVKEAGKTTY